MMWNMLIHYGLSLILTLSRLGMFYTVGLDSCLVLMVPPECYKFGLRLTSCMRLCLWESFKGPCWRHILVGQFDFHFCQILIWTSFYATWEFPDHTRAIMKSQTYLRADYGYRLLGAEKIYFYPLSMLRQTCFLITNLCFFSGFISSDGFDFIQRYLSQLSGL